VAGVSFLKKIFANFYGFWVKNTNYPVFLLNPFFWLQWLQWLHISKIKGKIVTVVTVVTFVTWCKSCNRVKKRSKPLML